MQHLASLILAGLALVTASAIAQPLLVGRSLPLSGPLQSIGELKRDGADAYLHKVNSTGGVAGRKVETITWDDGYVADNTVANLRRIASEHKPLAFLSLLRVPAAGHEIPLLDELKIPVVGIASATHLLRARLHRYGFPVRASVTDEGRELAKHVKVVGIDRIAIVFQDVPLGHSTRQSMDAGLREVGLQASHVLLDAAATQAAEVARSAVQSKPQAIFLGVLTPAAAALILELRKLSFNGSLYTFSSTDVVVLTKLVGDRAVGVALSQIVPMSDGLRVKVVAEYIQAVKELGKGSPTMLGLEGFLEAKILVEGLRRSGPKPTSEGLVRALETLRDFDLGGFFVNYSPQAHTGSLFVEIDMIGPGGKLMR
ncbi:ABC-type branched-chain amino acid transport system, periplasmic component [Acidovorax sp. CF316]|uniref:ABC transporter substrate-binding protein n=1 Tax=Acidovorax sp. CF316 TaxID=1144317 RepID=UPI00026BE1D3|nr:ABC transporter substrate-binding protein [Acidovorax sp. CF316]EJE52873.1 ABC-type branched-chain amino acid transport system, periplasmic component [Acidovorax sp. CF316]